MSTAIAKNLQVGSDPTATNNFTIFQPATPDGTLRIGNGNTGITTSLVTLNSSGNLGLGVTPSAWSGYKALQIGNAAAVAGFSGNFAWLGCNWFNNGSGNRYINTGFATLYEQSSGQHIWNTAPSGTAGNAISFTQAMTLSAAGQLQLGTTTANGLLTLKNTNPSTSLISIQSYASTAENVNFKWDQSTDIFSINTNNVSGEIAFGTGTSGTERARITSTGVFLVGTTSVVSIGGLDTTHTFSTGTTTKWAGGFRNTSSSAPYGLALAYSAVSPNNTASDFIWATDSTIRRFSVASNGGISNYQANDVNVSDRREKTNFAPAKSYLDTICAIPVQTFNYIDQNMEEDPGLTLGVVAQDVQAVAPELVMESNWGTKDEPKTRLSIYQTDLQYALMKALQELKSEFDAYKLTHP